MQSDTGAPAASGNDAADADMVSRFTQLMRERRSMDVVLGEARRSFSSIDGAIRILGTGGAHAEQQDEDAIEQHESAIALLSAEVDCQRRALDAVSRLDDEKGRLLTLHRAEHDRDTRRLGELFGCGELADTLEDLRQTEQRVRDIEDALLADAAAEFTLDDASERDRQQLVNEEQLLRGSVRELETAVGELDEQLRALSAKDAEHINKSSSSAGGGGGAAGAGGSDQSMQAKRGVLRSKIAHKSAVVSRLATAADAIAPNSAIGNSKGISSFASAAGGAVGEDDPLASSLRSYSDTHKIIALVKAASVHLRDDYEEISSAISRFSVDKSMLAADRAELLRWSQAEMQKTLYDVSRLAASVLDEQLEDAEGGISVQELLRAIRRFCVLYDVLEPALGKRELFEQVRVADDFGVMPQLYTITTAALDVAAELKKMGASHHHHSAASRTPTRF